MVSVICPWANADAYVITVRLSAEAQRWLAWLNLVSPRQCHRRTATNPRRPVILVISLSGRQEYVHRLPIQFGLEHDNQASHC
jgi:hypothetical protein